MQILGQQQTLKSKSKYQMVLTQKGDFCCDKSSVREGVTKGMSVASNTSKDEGGERHVWLKLGW